jgi:hypothetical protein
MAWVIQCASGEFWLEEGGVTTSLDEAERFRTKTQAEAEIQKWCHPRETAYAVKLSSLVNRKK